MAPAQHPAHQTCTEPVPLGDPADTGPWETGSGPGLRAQHRIESQGEPVMNRRYTLAADCQRWWWPAATAGTATAAAITFVLATTWAGTAAIPEPIGTPPTTPTTGVQAPGPGHPCFLVRHTWNEGLDGPQPICH